MSMAIALEGLCRVFEPGEGEPDRDRGLSIRQLVGRHMGAEAISLRILECAPGNIAGLAPVGVEEVLFVTAGEGTIHLDGRPFPVKPMTGVYVRPGIHLAVESSGGTPLVLASSQCPEPVSAISFEPPKLEPVTETAPGPDPSVYLWDRTAGTAGDRWYRVMLDHEVGSRQVTQFVGAIPTGRAPDHFHHYEEVIVILEGSGRMWTGKRNTRIRPGSCIYLPPRQVHCLENTGDGELRLLGVFYPAGSPDDRRDAN